MARRNCFRCRIRMGRLGAALPGALRQLERTLEATRAAAEGGWEI